MNTKIVHSICFLLVAISCEAFSQKTDLDVYKMRDDAQNAQKKITNWYNIVDVQKTDEAFVIYYDINGSKKDEYEVSLMLVRDSDPNFYVIPKQITGNIGVGSFAGKNNSIVWNYKKDIFKELIGNDYRFKLTIQKINQSSFPWLWTGLGAAVAAGTAAILILRGKNAGPGQSEATTIPALGLSRPN